MCLAFSKIIEYVDQGVVSSHAANKSDQNNLQKIQQETWDVGLGVLVGGGGGGGIIETEKECVKKRRCFF